MKRFLVPVLLLTGCATGQMTYDKFEYSKDPAFPPVRILKCELTDLPVDPCYQIYPPDLEAAKRQEPKMKMPTPQLLQP